MLWFSTNEKIPTLNTEEDFKQPFFKEKLYIFRFFIEKEPEPLCVLLDKEETDKKQRKV